MGQSPSSTAGAQTRKITPIKLRSIAPMKIHHTDDVIESTDDVIDDSPDYTNDLPDECLAIIFQGLSSGDRKSCSLVCRRWLQVEGQSRHRLSLNAQSQLAGFVLSIFTRFDSVAKLALKCDRRSASIADDALVLISTRLRNLTRLKLRACREITDSGIGEFSKNCKSLKKLSCGSCNFGAKGMNFVLNNCPALEEISIKRLRGINDGAAAEPIGPGAAAASLKVICLKELYNGQCFGPLIIGARNLRTLKLFRCSGDWDKLLEVIADRVNGLVEVHLERLQVSDTGLFVTSNYSKLEILHLVKTPECTNDGLKEIAEKCKLLRKLHIDGWKTNRIGDEGLIAVAKNSGNLQELVLIGVNPTKLSLEKLAKGCPNLERLALCVSETVGDAEISCIAQSCTALKKLCIKSCPVSDHGMEALAGGCPNLVKVKVKKCRAVTSEGADWLRASRAALTVNLDAAEVENADAAACDSGGGVVENSPVGGLVDRANLVSSSHGRSSFKARLLTGRTMVACTFRRWSSFGSGSSRSRGN